MRALEAALAAVWAMEERALEALLDMLAREHEVTPDALEAYRAKSLANARQAETRNGVAILPAFGPLVKRANFFTEVCGGASYDVLRQDLQTALDDPKIKAILLYIDSPGGEASGTAELAQAIFDARGQKPITAYITGYGASAAYWAASAADRVVVDPTAIVGSIGVQAGFKVREPKAGEKSYRFVSSNAPNKNPEIGSDQAAQAIQSTIDAMESVFIADVARNRGVATETVLSDFGKGGTFVGQAAVEAGLADAVGNFEGVLSELSKGRRSTKAKGATMSDDKTFTAADMSAAVATAVADAMAQATARTAAVHALGVGFGLDSAALTAALAGSKTVADLAIELAPAAATARTAAVDAARAEGHAAGLAEGKKAKGTAALAALANDEGKAGKVEASDASDEDVGTSAQALADSIINA